ncbi:MAG: RluA family pseudouridine synthase [Alphaproteobacteria bacterium]|nr:RluA family pseudouridine synthase [Alphaproteobacteria bacterium]
MMNDFEKICKEKVLLNEQGIRLDKWLSDKLDMSRSRITNLIKDGFVTINGIITTSADKKTCLDDEVTLSIPAPTPAEPIAQDIPLDIVYEDDDLLVLNKAAGIVVHPACGNYEGTLVNALLAHCHGSLSGIGGVARPGIVHRLDKDTSGLLVVAKNDKAHVGLSEQFQVHSLTRCYLAIVWGMFSSSTGVIENYIGRSPFDRKKMAIVQNGGKRAETHYTVKKILKEGIASLVECSLKTGRTHQVRVHMTSLGHSLIGDDTYGRAPRLKNEMIKELAQFPRQALHSYKMSFIHPVTQKEMFFEIPLPPDMQAVIDKFG